MYFSTILEWWISAATNFLKVAPKIIFNEIFKIMIIADLYIRVSTDEQAEKGYSQRDKNERLRKFCENNNIIVSKVIYEDQPAKSFERPEWKSTWLK